MKLTFTDPRVNYVDLVRRGFGVRIWHLDLAVKYWEPGMLGYDHGQGHVWLFPSERSRGMDPELPEDDHILLTIDGPLRSGRSFRWQLEATSSKYSVWVFLWDQEPLRWKITRKYNPRHHLGIWWRMRKLGR